MMPIFMRSCPTWPLPRLLILVLTVLTALTAAVPPAWSALHLYQHYTEREGLINNAVNAMVQGPDGLLWFATRGGIMSYDGQSFRHQGPDLGIREKEFSHLTVGPQGRVWAVSKRVPYRVQFLEDGVWKGLPLPPLPYANTNTCLFAVEELTDGSLVVAVAVDDGQFCLWRQDRWQLLDDPRITRNIHACEVRGGRMLAVGPDGPLEIDLATGQVGPGTLAGTPAGQVMAMATDAATGDLWLVGPDWVGRQRGGVCEVLGTGLEIVQQQEWGRTSALVDRNGGLYFGGLSRAYYFHPEIGLEPLDRTSGRPATGATDFLLDHEGNLWITSLRGVDKLVSRRFAGLDRSQGLLQDEVTAVLADSRGRMLLGHEGGLTFLEPDPRHLPFALPGDVLCRVMDLAEDPAGNTWVATDGQGLGRIDRAGALTWLGPDQGVDLRTFAVLADSLGRIWVGQMNGMVQGDGRRFREVPLPGLAQGGISFVRRIQPAGDGSLYLATGSNGVVRFRDGRVEQWVGSAVGSGNSTFAVAESPDGRIWAGTGVGLFILQGGKLARTTAPDPVIDRPVYAIGQDPAGRYWFGTDNGVYVWDGQELRNFSVAEGLIGTEINRAALATDASGRLWIGTDRGVSIYRAELDLPPLGPPRLEILGFDADGTGYPADQVLELESPPRTLLVNFRGLSFTDERRLTFRTWLENYDADWNSLSGRLLNQVRYTNLPAGTYRFHIQAVNPGGTSSPEVVTPIIRIRPPLRERWWVLGLGLLVTAVLGYLVVSFWEGKRYARQLEQQVQRRTLALERSEQGLRAESQRLAATLDSILDGVLALDQDDCVVLCNPAAEAILRRPARDVVGRPVAEVLPLEDDLDPDELPGSAAAGRRRTWTCPVRGRVQLDVSTSPITDLAGRPAGRVLAFSDVTDRLRMERDLIRSQKLESLGLLAGGIAHDFNNLLTILLGNIDLVEKSDRLDDLDRESLGLARQATLRARTLTERLLTFARGGTPRRQTVSLQEIVDQSVALSFSGLNLRCEVDLPADLWLVDADPGQLHQVLNNLLINAAQAQPARGPVRVRAHNVDKVPPFLAAGQWVRLDVADSGPGIAEGDLPRIFDPYFTTKSEGTGLGLATSFSIITRHGGRLLVESQPGKGAVFTIYLPRGHGLRSGAPAATPAPAVPRGRVLVLEDEAGIRHTLQRNFQRLGIPAVFTSEGEEALAEYAAAQMQGRPFDLVVTDLTIPGGLGGLDTLARLREMDPLVKAVVISGYSHQDVLANCGKYGFAGALAKPFHFEDLVRVMGQVLDSAAPGEGEAGP